MIFSSKTGASVPRPPSIDSNEDREMDLNNHNENMDQEIPAWQFPTALSGPIAQFLNGMPDWMNMMTSTWQWKASQSFRRTCSTWNLTAGGYRGKFMASYTR
jgi:hypothetical protein